jgi:hypothetical protein
LVADPDSLRVRGINRASLTPARRDPDDLLIAVSALRSWSVLGNLPDKLIALLAADSLREGLLATGASTAGDPAARLECLYLILQVVQFFLQKVDPLQNVGEEVFFGHR